MTWHTASKNFKSLSKCDPQDPPGIQELESGGGVGLLPHQPLKELKGVAKHLQQEVLKVMGDTVLAHDLIYGTHGQHTKGFP